MYGIRFRGNDDLRALLLYEGFVGHPLRKDYPKDGEQPLIPMRDRGEARVNAPYDAPLRTPSAQPSTGRPRGG